MQQKGKKCWAKKLFKADNVTSLLIQKSFKINHNSNCTHNCLVNVFIKFQICFKQYAGNNADTFRKRWYIYKNSTRLSRGESCIQRHFFSKPWKHWFRRACLKHKMTKPTLSFPSNARITGDKHLSWIYVVGLNIEEVLSISDSYFLMPGLLYRAYDLIIWYYYWNLSDSLMSFSFLWVLLQLWLTIVIITVFTIIHIIFTFLLLLHFADNY